jgi:hypothetical protein
MDSMHRDDLRFLACSEVSRNGREADITNFRTKKMAHRIRSIQKISLARVSYAKVPH